MIEAIAWPLALGVSGAIFGSFIAAIVVRWPQGRSVLHGRSACDACGHRLRAIDLVPLLSAAMLRSKCRDCGAAIDPRHARIELAATVTGVLAGLVAPGLDALAGAVFGWMLLALASLDLEAMWLPDRLTATLAGGGLATGLLGAVPSLADRLIGGAAGFAVLWGIAALYRGLRGREGMGGGDPKLMGAIGLWLGWRMLPGVLLVASLLGLGVVLVAQLRGRPMAADEALPFGALLAIAAYSGWLAMIGLGA